MHIAPAPRRRVPPPTKRRSSRASLTGPCLVRQDASAFDKPLALDTSSVTTMQAMFYVRITPQHIASGATPPRDISTHTHASRAAPPHRAMPRPTERNGIQSAARLGYLEGDHHARHVPSTRHSTPPPHHSTPHHTPTGPCLVRQDAPLFNQPLAWNVSSVTTMHNMFRGVPVSTCNKYHTYTAWSSNAAFMDASQEWNSDLSSNETWGPDCPADCETMGHTSTTPPPPALLEPRSA